MARKRHVVLRHGTFTEVGVHHTQRVCGSQQVSKGAPSLRPRSAHGFRSVMLERSCAPEEDRRYVSGSTWFQVPSRDVSDQSPDHWKGAEAASGKAAAAPHPLPSLVGGFRPHSGASSFRAGGPMGSGSVSVGRAVAVSEPLVGTRSRATPAARDLGQVRPAGWVPHVIPRPPPPSRDLHPPGEQPEPGSESPRSQPRAGAASLGREQLGP